MKSLAAILSGLLLAACNGDNATDPTPQAGQLILFVNVAGDMTTAPPEFAVVVDGSKHYSVAPNEVSVVLLPLGTHTVDLSLTTTAPSSCTTTGATRQVANIRYPETATVRFVVDCVPPGGLPQVGGSRLALSFSIVGGGAVPDGVNVHVAVQGTSGEGRFAFYISAAAPPDLQIPAGSYDVFIGDFPLTDACWVSGLDYWLGRKVTVRGGERAELAFQLICHS